MNGWDWRDGKEKPCDGSLEREFLIETEIKLGNYHHKWRFLAHWDGESFVDPDDGGPMLPSREPSGIETVITRWVEVQL